MRNLFSCVTLYKKTGIEMKDRKKLLGQRLKTARLGVRLGQEFVATSAGVTRQSVSAWETGASCPSAIQLADLAALYCVSAHELLFGEIYAQVDVLSMMRGEVAS